MSFAFCGLPFIADTGSGGGNPSTTGIVEFDLTLVEVEEFTLTLAEKEEINFDISVTEV